MFRLYQRVCLPRTTTRVTIVRTQPVVIRSQYWARPTPMVLSGELLMLRKKGGGGGKGGKTDKNEPEKFQDADSLDFNTAGTRMVEVVERFTGELAPLRVGRADASLLEPIQVSVKTGNKRSTVPLSSVAQVHTKDGSTLSVSPFDQGNLKEILQSLRDSDLELNPSLNGQIILVPVPSPTKEFKEKLVALATKHAEEARVAIRGVRQKLMSEVKDAKLPKDEDRKAQDKAQQLHDKYIQNIEKLLKDKQQQLRK